MLRLVFYTQERLLKVRPALPEDSFENACNWQNKLEFITTNDPSFTMVWTYMLPDLGPVYARALVELAGARYPISPNFEKLQAICPEIVFKTLENEWVFYGGSFNPWHQGHQACLNLLPADKLCLVLPDRNPYKELTDVNPVSAVLEISTRARFSKNQLLVPTFLLENKKNPTVYWIKNLKEKYPTLRLSLLMGFDSFSQLKTWTNAQELMSCLDTLYVVSRLEEDQDRFLALDEAHALKQNLNVVFLGKHSFEDVSSTKIRRRSEDLL